MKFGFGFDLTIGGNQHVGPSVPAGQLVAEAAAYWFDKRAPGNSGNSLANLGTAGGTATRGIPGATFVPVDAPHTGVHYVKLPGTAGNQVSIPRPFATTHVTITYLNDTTTTFTTTADPVVVGGTTHSGNVKTVALRETDGAGAVGAEIHPARDVDVTSNPDAGQTGWTDATSSTAVTVARSSTGIKTAVVTMPTDLCNGHVWELPLGAVPSFTQTTGTSTIVQLGRAHPSSTSTGILFGTGASIYQGHSIYASGGTSPNGTVRSAAETVVSSSGSAVRKTSILQMNASVADSGSVRGFSSDKTSLGVAGDYSGFAAAPNFVTARGPRIMGSPASASPSATIPGELVAALVFTTALSLVDLQELFAYLKTPGVAA